jgi:hypothetical protein
MMQIIATATDLKIAIKELEKERAEGGILLKEQFFNIYESFKLSNVLKRTLKEAIAAPDLRNNVINTAIGLTTGFVAKKTLVGKTYNPLKKLFGVVLEITVANKIAEHADKIKLIGNIVLNKIIHLKSDYNKG